MKLTLCRMLGPVHPAIAYDVTSKSCFLAIYYEHPCQFYIRTHMSKCVTDLLRNLQMHSLNSVANVNYSIQIQLALRDAITFKDERYKAVELQALKLT